MSLLSDMCLKAIIGAILFSSIFLVQGCDHNDTSDGIKNMVGFIQPPPPLSVTFRKSALWNGRVMQLHNTSNNRIVARVYVKNEQQNQSSDYSVGIAPNAMEEVGTLEMNWNFVTGENGYISVDGYTKKVYFDLCQEGKYRIDVR